MSGELGLPPHSHLQMCVGGSVPLINSRSQILKQDAHPLLACLTPTSERPEAVLLLLHYLNFVSYYGLDSILNLRKVKESLWRFTNKTNQAKQHEISLEILTPVVSREVSGHHFLLLSC